MNIRRRQIEQTCDFSGAQVRREPESEDLTLTLAKRSQPAGEARHPDRLRM
jgi:hypothetical protein